jgi:hypothetical protein
MNSNTDPCVERTTLAGDELLTHVRRLVDAGNVRRIAIQTERQRTLIEIPRLLGAASESLDPVWGAVRSLGDQLARCTIVVEREVAWPTSHSGRG